MHPCGIGQVDTRAGSSNWLQRQHVAPRVSPESWQEQLKTSKHRQQHNLLASGAEKTGPRAFASEQRARKRGLRSASTRTPFESITNSNSDKAPSIWSPQAPVRMDHPTGTGTTVMLRPWPDLGDPWSIVHVYEHLRRSPADRRPSNRPAARAARCSHIRSVARAAVLHVGI